MNAKQRIKQLEKTSAASGDVEIRVFITTEDGGAWEVGGATYAAAEYAELLKQWAARGEEVIYVRRDHDN